MKKIFLFVCSASLSVHAMEKGWQLDEKALVADLQKKITQTLGQISKCSEIPHLGAMAVYDFYKKFYDTKHSMSVKSKEILKANGLLNDDDHEAIPSAVWEVMFPIIRAKQSEKNTEEKWKTEELEPHFPAFEKDKNNDNKEGVLDLTNISVSQLKVVEG